MWGRKNESWSIGGLGFSCWSSVLLFSGWVIPICSNYGGLLGQISQSLSSAVRSKVAQDKFMAVGGGIVAIIGLAVTVYGFSR